MFKTLVFTPSTNQLWHITSHKRWVPTDCWTLPCVASWLVSLSRQLCRIFICSCPFSWLSSRQHHLATNKHLTQSKKVCKKKMWHVHCHMESGSSIEPALHPHILHLCVVAWMGDHRLIPPSSRAQRANCRKKMSWVCLNIGMSPFNQPKANFPKKTPSKDPCPCLSCPLGFALLAKM